ncbi:hypothetical protein AOLI_G00139360 [Acnodon oligacanthus]
METAMKSSLAAALPCSHTPSVGQRARLAFRSRSYCAIKCQRRLIHFIRSLPSPWLLAQSWRGARKHTGLIPGATLDHSLSLLHDKGPVL